MAKKPKEEPLFGGLDIVTSEDAFSLCIGNLPGRKKYALYTVAGSAIEPLAYFQSRDAAENALGLIRMIASGRWENG